MKNKRAIIPRTFVPNAITSLNLLSGFLSIIYASKGEFYAASFLIIFAALFDAVDGLIARALKVASKFGVQLDSLADVVSFGAAPAYLIYSSYLIEYDILGILVSSLLLIFGAFRLAIFNIKTDDLTTKHDFSGLPIPVSAISIASFVIAFHHKGAITEPMNYAVIPLVILLAVLMVSKIKYNKFPKLNKSSLSESKFLIFIIVFGVIVGLFTKDLFLFIIFISIVLFGIFRHIYLKIFNRTQS